LWLWAKKAVTKTSNTGLVVVFGGAGACSAFSWAWFLPLVRNRFSARHARRRQFEMNGFGKGYVMGNV